MHDEENEKSYSNPDPVVFTVKELSNRWGLPTCTIYDLIKENIIPTLPINGGKRILKSAIFEIEEDALFDPRSPKSIREKKLEEELLSRDKIINELQSKLVKIHCLTTDDAYQKQLKRNAK